MRKLVITGATLAVAVFAAPAFGAHGQPGQGGEASAGRDGGATTPGPHCHSIDPAAGAHFAVIITPAIHEGHIHAGNDVFTPTSCSG